MERKLSRPSISRDDLDYFRILSTLDDVGLRLSILFERRSPDSLRAATAQLMRLHGLVTFYGASQEYEESFSRDVNLILDRVNQRLETYNPAIFDMHEKILWTWYSRLQEELAKQRKITSGGGRL